MFRCLTNQRTQLSPLCRATLFDEEVRFSQSIDFHVPMKEACKLEMLTYCKGVPHENALTIRCAHRARVRVVCVLCVAQGGRRGG